MVSQCTCYLLVLSSEQSQVSSLKREYAMEALQGVHRLLFDFVQAAGSLGLNLGSAIVPLETKTSTKDNITFPFI